MQIRRKQARYGRESPTKNIRIAAAWRERFVGADFTLVPATQIVHPIRENSNKHPQSPIGNLTSQLS